MAISKEEQTKLMLANSGVDVLKKVKGTSLDEMILSLAIFPSNEDAKYILKQYEYLLVLAYLNPKKYLEEKQRVHVRLVDHIEENKLYSCWASLRTFLGTNTNVELADYGGILLFEMDDTWTVMSNRVDHKTAVGITRDGESLLYLDTTYSREIIRLTDLKIRKDRGQISDITYRKKASEIMTPQIEFELINEPVKNAAIINTMYFVNERIIEHISLDKIIDLDGTKLIGVPIRKDKFNDIVEALTKRNRTLAAGGVLCELANGNKVKSVFFIEDVTADGTLYVFIKCVMSSGREAYSWYAPAIKKTFSFFEFCDDPSAFQIYLRLTCDLYYYLTCYASADSLHDNWVVSVGDLDLYRDRKDGLYCKITEIEGDTHFSEPTRTSKGKRKAHYRSFTDRRLPDGWEVSDSAKKAAVKHGLVLGPGRTFVHGFWTGESEERKIRGVVDIGARIY